MADDNHWIRTNEQAIRPGGTNFASMQSVEQLQSIEASAPAWHRTQVDTLKRYGKVREDQQSGAMIANNRPVKPKFETGAVCRNSEGKKCTIIQASAGYTRKSNTPVHKVANKAGKVWLEKESDLIILI